MDASGALIALRIVQFFDRSWSLFRAKTDDLTSEAIESITKIDVAVLNIRSALKITSIAKKMSWAAGRKTKRIEDRAYSLVGFFGVYMAPIYGERAHAFIRLQEAILKTSNGHSVSPGPPRQTIQLCWSKSRRCSHCPPTSSNIRLDSDLFRKTLTPTLSGLHRSLITL